MLTEEDKRDALFFPTEEKALKFWDYKLLGTPEPDAPLAGLHKVRLNWPESTEAMKEESRTWLTAHGFSHIVKIRF